MGNFKNPLKSVKKILQKQEKEVEEELARLKKDDPFLQEDRLFSNEPATDAYENEGHERIMAQTEFLNRTLLQLRRALARIGMGKYGTCEKCQKKIEDKRLKVFPAATLCFECESELEAKNQV